MEPNDKLPDTSAANNDTNDCKALGDVRQFTQSDNTFLFTCEPETVKITFYSPDIIRIQMDSTGEFTDPTGGIILSPGGFKAYPAKAEDAGEYYRLCSEKCVLRVYKNPLLLAMYDSMDRTTVWEESSPLQYSAKACRQILKSRSNEYYYGGGVQNGYFSHKNKTIQIENVISHWNDGSVSNPMPFYMSTSGYGAFRNTFSTGVYECGSPAVLTHNENRFDCFYFYGPSLYRIIERYTMLTGRPTLIPRWGFGLGDADCYNTSNTTYTGTQNKPGKGTTLEVLKIAEAYRDKDMPGSWILPNDGYGCGYTDLDQVVKEAWDKYGFRIGLWTQNGVEKIAKEVGELGSRMCKLDVAWVGPGYDFALNACKSAFSGIEDNTVRTDEKGTYSERGYVWSVCGWAGTQRYSAVWSGDQSGNWEYIRFHIPTYIGAGLSGMPFIGSDVDGIFGGSAKTQVRDLQWKAFTPILLNMSGWSERDKQPWVWGEPYTSINRKYLKLRQKMMPYIYTYAAEAYESGAPIVRAMVLEYPNDPYAKGTGTQYQFMCGRWLLVAPVFEDRETRDEIYLPCGTWMDYWTGKQYEGGRIINEYSAPLDVLPLFVKAGAIIPMYPESLYDGQVLPGDEHLLTVEVYPKGITKFNLYEDDGHTTLHRQGKFSHTVITSKEMDGKAYISVSPVEGSYDGMPFARRYKFVVHTTVAPETVTFRYGETNEQAIAEKTCNKQGQLTRVNSMKEWEETGCCCWYFDKLHKGGSLYIKTKSLPLMQGFEIELDKFDNEVHVEVPEGLEVPGIPRNIRITEAQDTSLKLEWDAVHRADYYEAEADGMIYSNLKTVLKHHNLEFVSCHNYRVRAVNAAGPGQWSTVITGTTLEDKLKDAVPSSELHAYATSSLRERYDAAMAVDGDFNNQWISNYQTEKLPQIITVDMAKIHVINKITCMPREKGSSAVITKYNLDISSDGRNFSRIISGGIWEDDGTLKTIELKPLAAKSIRLEALETSKPDISGASAVQINIFKVPGTKGTTAADYTGDGRVDGADLNFVLQYYRIKKGDNDWAYVSKADIDRDGIIGIYDVAYVASLIEPAAAPGYENKAAGIIKLRPELRHVNKEQEFHVDIIGEKLFDMYAFECIIGIDSDKYKLTGFESGCRKDMTPVCKEKDGRAYVAYTCTSAADGIIGSGLLARIKLRALKDTEVQLEEESAVIVGTNLDVVNARSAEYSSLKESIFESKLPHSLMTATATSEDIQSENNGGANVLDSNPKTFWNTAFDKSGPLPQSLILDLGGLYYVSRIKCLPRPSGSYGAISSFAIYASDDSGNEILLREGTWVDNGKEKEEVFDEPVKASKIRIEAREGVGGYASMTEVNVYTLNRY